MFANIIILSSVIWLSNVYFQLRQEINNNVDNNNLKLDLPFQMNRNYYHYMNYNIFRSKITPQYNKSRKYSLQSHKKEFRPIYKYFKRNHRNITLRFEPRWEKGFANHFRSIRGLLILSIINNSSFCIDYQDYFDMMDNSMVFMQCTDKSPIPQMDHFSALKFAKDKNCNYHLYSSLAIATSDDLTLFMRNCNSFYKDIKNNLNGFGTKNLWGYVSRFLFYPKPYIVKYARSILKSMNGVKVGIQMRFGGNTSSTKESFHFLDPTQISRTILQIKSVLKRINGNYSIFLSSDTPLATKMLSPLNKNLYTARKYTIGHTKTSNKEFLNRAVTDIYILSHCNILIYTNYSSYGQIASDLSIAEKKYILRTN